MLVPRRTTPNRAPGPPGATGTAGNQQGVYIASVLRDRDSLFAGFVVSPRGLRFRLAETTSFEVAVCGVDSPRKACVDNLAAALSQPTSPPPTTPRPGGTPTAGSPPASPSSSPKPTTGSPRPTTTNPRASATPTATSTSNTNTVQIGGQVLVTATGSPTLTIQPLSQPVQPVLLKTESASWSFNVIPSALGAFDLAVHISVLQGANGPPLLPEQTISIPLEVYQTGGDRIATGASSFWKVVQQVAAVVGATGISVGAVATFLVRRVRRRRRASAAAVPAGLQPPYPTTPGVPARLSPAAWLPSASVGPSSSAWVPGSAWVPAPAWLPAATAAVPAAAGGLSAATGPAAAVATPAAGTSARAAAGRIPAATVAVRADSDAAAATAGATDPADGTAPAELNAGASPGPASSGRDGEAAGRSVPAMAVRSGQRRRPPSEPSRRLSPRGR